MHWNDAAGVPELFEYFDGGLETLTYAYYDYPDLFQEMVAMMDADVMRRLEMALENGAETILTGGSGSITMQSPALFCGFHFLPLKNYQDVQGGRRTVRIHSCGKEKFLIEKCAQETDLNYLNPLELPPMGGLHAAECKQLFGDKLAIMGNLHRPIPC